MRWQITPDTIATKKDITMSIMYKPPFCHQYREDDILIITYIFRLVFFESVVESVKSRSGGHLLKRG